ncbi:MAG: Gfo/Idh/MocA family oxidoreductase [Bacteroidales bacterium]|nr:Gfo/Idh/MocA family oxidoreductase [Bacteroidales bacterium]
MSTEKANQMDRRKFLSYSALGLAGLTILPDWVMANGIKVPPSDRVVMGFIGLGQQGRGDYYAATGCPGVQVIAGCDVDALKRERFKRNVEAWQKSQNVPPRCDMYEFYEDLLERKDIDAVGIETPDHWHAFIAIAAAKAKKDIYVQKPMAFTVTEGLAMVAAVRKNGVVLQVGSQQRSDKEFQQAIAIVRSGGIGHVETIYSRVGDPPKPFDLLEQPIPGNLNWNLWLGGLNDPKIHYHPDLCPPIILDPEQNEQLWGAWRWYRETGNGFTADWGAHMFDIAQAAIGMDGSGPCEFIPKGYNGAKYLTMKYQNGIVMTEQDFRKEGGQGICFNGTKGWLKVTRGYIECSDKRLLEKEERKIAAGEYEKSTGHMQNFIDCVRSRKNPVAPVEVGCSTNTLCCIANIATELQRPVKWDPATLSFGDDIEAASHRLYKYPYRRPYSL